MSFRSACALLFLLSFLYSCRKTALSPVVRTPPPFGFYVVGYFPSYRSLAGVPDNRFRMCNVVNYAFFAVDSAGLLRVQNPALVPQLIQKAKAGGAKVFLSINDGKGDGQTYFTTMAATESGRRKFVEDVMRNVRRFGFDGVDIDWEFPRTTNGTDRTFTALMKELSDSLHVEGRYYLTAALTAGRYAGSVRDAIQPEVFAYGDFFHIMSYDDFSTTTPYRHHSPYSLSVASLDYWIGTRGMPREKCVLGIPGYGRPSGIPQSGTVLAYRDILARGGSPLSDSAVVTSSAFPAPYTIYYNGQPTVKRKAALAKERAGGIMLWELWQDTPDETSLLKAACDTIGRVY